jgi:hypothetical protein
MKLIKLTHATLNVPLTLVSSNIFGAYYSEGIKATLVLSTGTTVVPVKESVKQVEELIGKPASLNPDDFAGQNLP